ncbi:MAG: SGNH/GDSL hydrolase family protein [Bacilli bacterium]|nr:SGNH/GDSL hydrolase family protein [Bacilli bacterium]
MKYTKIAFLGDSITEGALASKEENIYHQVVTKDLGVTCLNYGKSGTRIAKQKDPKNEWDHMDFQTRMKDIPTDCSFVFVFGGTNDYGHGDALIGDFESYDPYTFIGGLRNIIEYLCKTFSKERICFLLPPHRYNEDDGRGECGNAKKIPYKPLSAYVRAMEKVISSYEIDMIDLRTLWDVPSSDKPNLYVQDGLHPNDKGHILIAKTIEEYLKKKAKKQ